MGVDTAIIYDIDEGGIFGRGLAGAIVADIRLIITDSVGENGVLAVTADGDEKRDSVGNIFVHGEKICENSLCVSNIITNIADVTKKMTTKVTKNKEKNAC